ncbi:hypothetical protein DT73_25875 [Mangrovibacter sp. MFB070]|uniref:DUF1330 domain-containing protein n=1 Tax=Mangrovibacter sp. MFB070 TaxID=1224318 RepID=UPI0004D48A22|nr:DUF1330 domain-containing protein [Mangrovibacter sp. MFB070]KEA49990.1 hypothetical protein DT73_25875 [Mangrovibacter sp. MFB070]
MENKAYFIFDVKINNPDALKPYQEKVAETFKKYGGVLRVLGGKMDTVEGYAPNGILVMLEFDNMEKAHEWHSSPEYQSIIQYRHAAADTTAWLVESVSYM